MRATEPEAVCIIGGGLGGLASACTLAARGHRVRLYERNDWLGGKAAVLEEAGFRFDMGPTILTLPSVLRKIFAEAGHDLQSRLPLIKLDPQWRCFFEDGATLDLVASVDQMTQHLDRFTGDRTVGQKYREFIDLSSRLHAISDRYFFWRSVNSIWDTFQAGGMFQGGVLSDLLTMRPGQTVAGTVRSFIRDERVAQMIDHFTQYVGSAPDASPAVLCGIAHMQTDEGIWYPIGGTQAIAAALVKLALEQGVEIVSGTAVRRILVRNGRVNGIETEHGETIGCSSVISNCDAVRTYRELVGGSFADRFDHARSYEPACSGVVLYLGLRERYEHLLHHNFVFSKDAHDEFEMIYRRGEPAADPTCYVCAPAQTDPSVAPAGGEALYVLVHTPYLRPHHRWEKMLPQYRDVILDKLAKTAGLSDIRERIVYESALTPADIHRRYRVLDGAIYGLASHGRFLGAFKPGNRSPYVEGLYLAGGAAHPGPGMPMVLMSGWIAADTLDHDAGQAATLLAGGKRV